MKYTINEMANIVGVGIETLRHYEDKGILTPQRDEKNNYRLYSIGDIRKFNTSRTFRTYGFSIQETKDLLEWKSLDFMQDNINNKLEDLKMEKIFLEEKINKLKLHGEMLNEINYLKDNYIIKEMPDIYYFETQRVDEYQKNLENDYLKRQWIEYFPITQWARRIKKSKVKSMSGELKYDNGIMIECEKAKEIGFPKNLIDSAEKINGGKVWYTIFDKEDDEPYDWHIFELIFKQINDQGYEVCGDVITFYLSSKIEDDNLINYHYCMIKIK